MEATTTPTLEESLAKFAARVAEGKATPEELAFMTKVARNRLQEIPIDVQCLGKVLANHPR